ncbi:MAG TPA: glycosyltransferase [Candidatus Sulfotelmatobacter sp.]|nr:glycosyltransferase [Candidatus Sulfotelmatobacter sp.]
MLANRLTHMSTVAYLANQFPSAVEPYVVDEIDELRRRGVNVVAGSVRQPAMQEIFAVDSAPEITLLPWRGLIVLQAAWLCIRRWSRISDLVLRVLFCGRESPWQRAKALLHTWLGAGYALRLQEHAVEHIHVHHGYFGSWIAMVAARLLDVGFSLTLHGSDLLLHPSYLDVKLANCVFCLTVSEYNRCLLFERYPTLDANKVVVSRLGVEVDERANFFPGRTQTRCATFTLLSVGRLHVVKDHAFLVRACAQLQAAGVEFECSIAGDGPERRNLERLIAKYSLEDRVTLLGHVPREQMNSLYDRADVVVLTSRSEGIPLVLMEAMARGRIVLAPAITGIPELVIPGQTGFLYEPGSMGAFVARVQFIASLIASPARRTERPVGTLSQAGHPEWVRHAARVQVLHNFNRRKSLKSFADFFLQRIGPQTESPPHENSVLQQIQLPLQRHGGLPVRVDEPDAVAGPRGRPVFDV